mmetsp:Transcript_2644/g.6839  ORF Transcript_2644/g.6839 Transcript_2644/m.6839 type:complete len:119 (+) Transcript_2644:64-420(+)
MRCAVLAIKKYGMDRGGVWGRTRRGQRSDLGVRALRIFRAPQEDAVLRRVDVVDVLHVMIVEVGVETAGVGGAPRRPDRVAGALVAGPPSAPSPGTCAKTSRMGDAPRRTLGRRRHFS